MNLPSSTESFFGAFIIFNVWIRGFRSYSCTCFASSYDRSVRGKAGSSAKLSFLVEKGVHAGWMSALIKVSRYRKVVKSSVFRSITAS